MRRFAFAAWLGVLAWAIAAQAAPNGVPARPLSIGNWYDHDPVDPVPGDEPWTAADVAGFMALYPDAFFETGYEAAKPPGNKRWRDLGRAVGALRAILAQKGVDARSRLCVIERPDVLARYRMNVEACAPWRAGGGCDWEGDMDGHWGEAETVVKTSGRATAGSANALVDAKAHLEIDMYVHRILVLRPGAPNEERRRIAQNEAQMFLVDGVWNDPPVAGDAYQVLGSFDTAWIRRVSTTDHQATLQKYWTGARNVCGPTHDGPCAPPAQPLDPFDAQRGFESWVDQTAIAALRNTSSVPDLYGYAHDADEDPRVLQDPYFRATSVVMDLSNRAYRQWRARYAQYELEDMGFAKSDAVCLLVAYKPGLHTYNDPTANGVKDHPCADPTSHNWIGPSHVCSDGSLYHGPFEGTPYRAGEYETAVSAYFRDLFAGLAAEGWTNVRVISAEAPPYGNTNWSILADDVRRLPGMFGVENGWIEPKLAALAGGADPSASATDSSPPAPTSASDPGSSPAPTVPTTPGEPTTPPASPAPPASPPPASPPPPTQGSTTVSGGATSVEAAPRSAPAPTPAATMTDSADEPRRGGYVEKSGGGLAHGEIDPPTKDETKH